MLREERPGIEARCLGRPEEVADVIAFLCSERASFVDRSNYRVDSRSVATIRAGSAVRPIAGPLGRILLSIMGVT